MKKYFRLLTLLLFIGFFNTSALFAQNIDYESNISQFYGSNCGNDTGISTTEEHTWKGWIRDNVDLTETYSGCITCNTNGNCTQTGTYATRNRYNVSSTQIVGRIDAWEDDSGNRCDYDTGTFVNNDDCRANQTCTYNLTNPLEYQWTTANSTCGSGDYNMNLYRRYRYTTVTIPVAVENTSETFFTGGTRPFWGSRGAWAFSGSDCAASGTITDNQTSSFNTTVSCKSQVTFRWRVESQVNADFLEVYVNGTLRNSISGTVGWTLVTLNLDFGPNTIEWRYSKDGSVSTGLDRGFVDLISFIDATSISAGTVSGNQSICSGGNPANLSSTALAEAYGSTINYQWQFSNNGTTAWTNIGGATFADYDPPAGLTQTRYYRRRAQDNCVNIGYTNTITVTVNPLPNGNLAGTATICEGGSTNLIFNATAGAGPFDITYNGVTINNIASGTSIPVSPSANTTYTLSSITDNNGCTRTSALGASATITVNTNSTAPTISPVFGTQCPNTSFTLSASGGIAGTGSTIEWYTGPNGTGTYVGSGNTVIVSPSSTTNYYARREGTCNTTSDNSVTISIKDFVYTAAGNTSSNTYCTDNDGWHHFFDGDEVIFSIQGDLSGADVGFPTATIQDNGSFFQNSVGGVGNCTDGLSPGVEQFEMQRSWNVNFEGTLNPPYNVRYYFPLSEKTDIETAAANQISNNPTCIYTYTYANPLGFYWFKNTGTPYTAPMYDLPTQLTATTGNINGINYAEMTGITSFSGGSGGISLTPDPNLVLPVELLTFTGSNEGVENILQWVTASETNNSHFMLQHSAHPVDGFVDLERIEGMGTTTNTTGYSYTHENPLRGANYYRLKQVDFDGTFDYSEIIIIEVGNEDVKHLFFPNPTIDIVNYHFESQKEEEYKIEVVNILQQQMNFSTYNAEKGMNQLSIDMSRYPSGIYIIKVYNGNGALVVSSKITKQEP